MSAPATHSVVEHLELLPVHLRFLATLLAWKAWQPDGSESCPGEAWLARKLGVASRTVRRQLAELTARGVLVRTGTNGKRTRRFTVRLDAIESGNGLPVSGEQQSGHGCPVCVAEPGGANSEQTGHGWPQKAATGDRFQSPPNKVKTRKTKKPAVAGLHDDDDAGKPALAATLEAPAPALPDSPSPLAGDRPDPTPEHPPTSTTIRPTWPAALPDPPSWRVLVAHASEALADSVRRDRDDSVANVKHWLLRRLAAERLPCDAEQVTKAIEAALAARQRALDKLADQWRAVGRVRVPMAAQKPAGAVELEPVAV